MYQDLCTWDNLLCAYRRAAKGKRGHANVAAFEHHLEDNLLALQHELVTQTYQPGVYTSFYIHEPKRRLISAAPVRDRVVHHALYNLIEPLFERSFIFDSYANRVGKGTHRALNRAQEYARRHPYVLQVDVQQFFPSLDHACLRDCLAKKIDPEQTPPETTEGNTFSTQIAPFAPSLRGGRPVPGGSGCQCAGVGEPFPLWEYGGVADGSVGKKPYYEENYQ
jgi:hypothetical protein